MYKIKWIRGTIEMYHQWRYYGKMSSPLIPYHLNSLNGFQYVEIYHQDLKFCLIERNLKNQNGDSTWQKDLRVEVHKRVKCNEKQERTTETGQ